MRAGRVMAGRYRIAAPLGRGGMGEVYRADDLELGTPVALKFLPAELEGDPVRLERLRLEVRLARQVSHPNVCRVFDIGGAEGRLFLTMELVDGEDLASLLRSEEWPVLRFLYRQSTTPMSPRRSSLAGSPLGNVVAPDDPLATVAYLAGMVRAPAVALSTSLGCLLLFVISRGALGRARAAAPAILWTVFLVLVLGLVASDLEAADRWVVAVVATTGFTVLAVRSGVLEAVGKVVHRGRRTAVTEARMEDADGRLHAHATSTCLIVEV